MSQALREVILLLPLCRDIPDKIYDAVTESEILASVDPCFSGIASQVESRASKTVAGLGNVEDGSTSSHTIPDNEIIPEDEYLFSPIWFTLDVHSAISTTIDHLGVLAAKHGQYSYVC